jgi:ATP-binding cassette, subfamily B, bacterial
MRSRGGMRGMIDAPDEKPQITWPLLRRVGHYALPYRWLIGAMLLLILAHTGLALVTPLFLRALVDTTIPAGNVNRLALLPAALPLIPALSGAKSVVQRRISARRRRRDLGFAPG